MALPPPGFEGPHAVADMDNDEADPEDPDLWEEPMGDECPPEDDPAMQPYWDAVDAIPERYRRTLEPSAPPDRVSAPPPQAWAAAQELQLWEATVAENDYPVQSCAKVPGFISKSWAYQMFQAADAKAAAWGYGDWVTAVEHFFCRRYEIPREDWGRFSGRALPRKPMRRQLRGSAVMGTVADASAAWLAAVASHARLAVRARTNAEFNRTPPLPQYTQAVGALRGWAAEVPADATLPHPEEVRSAWSHQLRTFHDYDLDRQREVTEVIEANAAKARASAVRIATAGFGEWVMTMAARPGVLHQWTKGAACPTVDDRSGGGDLRPQVAHGGQAHLLGRPLEVGGYLHGLPGGHERGQSGGVTGAV